MSKKEEIAIKEEVTASEPAINQEKKMETKENIIYLGPSIPNLISSSTVFKDGVLPEAVNEKIKELPMLANLFVGISKMVETVKELNKKDSSLNVIYSRVKTETEKREV